MFTKSSFKFQKNMKELYVYHTFWMFKNFAGVITMRNFLVSKTQ